MTKRVRRIVLGTGYLDLTGYCGRAYTAELLDRIPDPDDLSPGRNQLNAKAQGKKVRLIAEVIEVAKP